MRYSNTGWIGSKSLRNSAGHHRPRIGPHRAGLFFAGPLVGSGNCSGSGRIDPQPPLNRTSYTHNTHTMFPTNSHPEKDLGSLDGSLGVPYGPIQVEKESV